MRLMNAQPIPTEFLQIWNLLALRYPAYCREMAAETLRDRLQLFYQLLADVPLDLLKNAALRHMTISRFFPDESELREAATALSAGPLPSAVEAWGEVLDAMARAEHYCFVDHVDVPQFANPITARLVASLGWRNLCLSENGIADRARFIESYEQLAARHENEQRLPPQLQAGAQVPRQLIASVAARLTGPDMRRL